VAKSKQIAHQEQDLLLSEAIASIIATTMTKGKKVVPARLQAALALLERLREFPSLNIDDHKSPNSAGIIGHEGFGNTAHARLNLDILNKNHGRRSCNIGEWGPLLLKAMSDDGFGGDKKDRAARISLAQLQFAEAIRQIIEQDPIEVAIKSRSAEYVIQDALEQADEKGKSGEVAQYLVGAKLMLRLKISIPVDAANKGDRKTRVDSERRRGDFEIEDAVIEVALGTPDEKHIQQIAEVLEDTNKQVWLLTRHDRVQSWTLELGNLDISLPQRRRVIVTSVESFVGQNISEIGGFSEKGMSATLENLFKVYNETWIARHGTPGRRIVPK